MDIVLGNWESEGGDGSIVVKNFVTGLGKVSNFFKLVEFSTKGVGVGQQWVDFPQKKGLNNT